MGWLLLILVVLAVAVLFWGVAVYNGLIKLKNRVDEAWSDIDVQLKRRYDLIPNVVETVKGYAKHEKGVFEKVTQARTAAMSAESDPKAAAAAEKGLTGALKTLFAVAENYPELKANQNFLSLQQELADTEDKIQAARRFYNGNVRDFNIKIEVFPNNLLAGMFGFTKRDLFEIEDEQERKNVEVKF
ncbi:LemA family protein [Patescibacteria group bacterium]|nr:LemA family protein [Patescibacteria group bacterium]